MESLVRLHHSSDYNVRVKFKRLSVLLMYNMTSANQGGPVACPYCQSKFKDSAELSKHIDGVHTGLGLLEGDTRKY